MEAETTLDGGPSLDASTSSLSTSFTLLPIACGETRIVPTNISVTLDDGAAPVALYRWVLRGPDDSVLLTVLGAPETNLDRGAYVLGGTLGAPEFNLTLYRGKELGLFTRSAGAEIPSLLQRFALTEGEYEIEAVVAIPESRSIEAGLRNGSAGGDSYSSKQVFDCMVDETCGQLQYRRFQFSTNGNLSGTATDGMLQLIFYGQGEYYLDGVRLRYVPDDRDLVLNDTFADVTEWSIGNSSTGDLQSRPIPEAFTAYGQYTLSLNAIDTLNNEGPLTSRTVEHLGCD